jgi:hypothetical protein
MVACNYFHVKSGKVLVTTKFLHEDAFHSYYLNSEVSAEIRKKAERGNENECKKKKS